MKAIRVNNFGGPEALSFEEVAVPDPGVGEARVKVEAAGLNFIDVYQRSGLYAMPLPITLGMEAAGTVDAVGTDVAGPKPGDRVAYAMQLGAYADFATVPAGKLVSIPDGVDMQQAAAVMLQGMTAHYLSHSTYPIQSGDTALIHAAAGGVGQLLVQLAKKCGARVIATVSTGEKGRLARDAGADEIIQYTEVDFEEEVKRLTDGAGVDVVYDSVGEPTFEKGLGCLKPRGYMVLFGQSGGPVSPVSPGTLAGKGSLYLTRPGLGNYVADRQELLQRAGDLFKWMGTGELKVRIDRTFPLDEADEAHRYLEGRKTKGKVLLIP
jgi:NADPH2:quinone reductase